MVSLGRVVGVVVALAAVASPVHAQTVPSPAASYEERYGEIMALAPLADRVADVRQLVLKRDAGEFLLERGQFYLLSPVGGRTVAVGFVGRGTFSFVAPLAAERARVREFFKADSLKETFTELVLIFTDSTLKELEGKVAFGAADGSGRGSLQRRIKEALDYLSDEEGKSFDPDVLAPLLNGESNGLFYAHIGRIQGDPVMFTINPEEVEGVRLLARTQRIGGSRLEESVAQFRPSGDARPMPALGERWRPARVGHYAIEVALPQTGGGGLDFRAAARLELASDTTIGPWLPFWLFSKLEVDSARWGDGAPATVFRQRESSLLWVRLDRPLARGDARTLHLFYRGEVVERFGDWFFIQSSVNWYPLPLEVRSLATFDLTFHTPKQLTLASVGERKDSTVNGRTLTSRWVTPHPVRNASFNVGLFEEHQAQEAGMPPVTVLYAAEAHKMFRGVIPKQRRAKEAVGADVLNSMKFFRQVFGEALDQRFYATEIPYGHGEAFPGLIHLSWATFQLTRQDATDELFEVFRAHEVAHQWWGIGVDYATYHDRWLSEGFSNFAGLWYLQTASKDPKKYFSLLDEWRTGILGRRREALPISLGHRVGTMDRPEDYSTMVYEKGAWVLHMLRIMLLDLKTMNEDRFTGLMRDFYQSHRGKRASTEDFRRTAERHAGADLGWFFDQWIHGTAVPTYRVAYRTEPADGQFKVRVRVEQQHVPDDFRMYVPIALKLGGDRSARVRVQVRGRVSELELPLLPSEPKELRFNDLNGVLAEVKMVGWDDITPVAGGR